MNVAGVVKDWLLIAFSWSVIRDTVTPINLFGYGIAFLGVAYYNHVKLQALKAKEAQKKISQADEEAGSLLQERDGHRYLALNAPNHAGNQIDPSKSGAWSGASPPCARTPSPLVRDYGLINSSI
uniref:Sugar phosphate transporter domain-containing protein n=1 Tax=Oryza punctata TaxID=4537 RepID=A0A0E0L480_ORYPU